jgi:hypothetical protein
MLSSTLANGAFVNHHQRKTLHALFAHPVSTNISLKEVESMLAHLGAEIDNRQKARVAVSLKGHTAVFHVPQHHLPKDEVMQLRHFLQRCDVDPARDFPMER